MSEGAKTDGRAAPEASASCAFSGFAATVPCFLMKASQGIESTRLCASW